MKKISTIKYHLILAGLLVLAFASCKKSDTNSDGQLEGSKGDPTISSVRTVSQSKVDSSRVDIYSTYNADGTVTKATVPNYNPQITAFDSTTATGRLGNYYAIMGANLGSATKVLVNNTSVPFNRALNSDNTVIFNIPSTTPYVQPLPNTLTIVTIYGSVSYKFTVLPPPPTITAASNFNFSANTELTLKGAGFSSVSAIKLRGTNDVVTIVSKNDTVLVVKMPASSATRTTLLYTYTSGSNTAAQTASAQEFVNFDNAYKIFTEGYNQNFQSASWAPDRVSTTVFKTGTKSLEMKYPAGNWTQFGFGWENIPKSFSTTYAYLTFWIKGGSKEYPLYIFSNSSAGGSGTFETYNKIIVPKDVWTYFKIPIKQLRLWDTGDTYNQLGWRIQGPDGKDETFYLDDVAFIK